MSMKGVFMKQLRIAHNKEVRTFDQRIYTLVEWTMRMNLLKRVMDRYDFCRLSIALTRACHACFLWLPYMTLSGETR